MPDEIPTTDLCLCMTCTQERKASSAPARTFAEIMARPFRYACEVCGNKRCPRHSNHRLACTGSNAVGQPGSFFQ